MGHPEIYLIDLTVQATISDESGTKNRFCLISMNAFFSFPRKWLLYHSSNLKAFLHMRFLHRVSMIEPTNVTRQTLA